MYFCYILYICTFRDPFQKRYAYCQSSALFQYMNPKGGFFDADDAAAVEVHTDLGAFHLPCAGAIA